MRIGYGKLARSWELDWAKASGVGGDIDCIRLLRRLSEARPDDEFFLVGRCKGGDPQALGYADNVVNPWGDGGWELPAVEYKKGIGPDEYHVPRDIFRQLSEGLELDALVLWVGQVANSNSPLPPSGEDWDHCDLTNPQVMAVNYTLYLLDMVNRMGIEPILLCPDPRNYWKPRELMRPLTRPILAQYEMERETRHEQYRRKGEPWQDGKVWGGSQIVSTTAYEYAGVELTALDSPGLIHCNRDPDRPHLIGVITNENRAEVPEMTARVTQLKKFVLERWPDAPIYGKWSDKSMTALERQVEPVPYPDMYDTLRQFRCTITLPASGSGWATAKAWEAFAVGTVMFFHHKYDDQGWILPRRDKFWKPLRKFLVVHTQRQFWQRVEELERDEARWLEIIDMQRRLFEMRFEEWQGGARRVLERLEQRDFETYPPTPDYY